MKKTALLIFSFVLMFDCLLASAERLSRSVISRQQDAIETRLADASRFLSEGNTASVGGNYNFANELLGQSVVRLSRTEMDLDRQTDQIAGSYWVIGAPNIAQLRERRDQLFQRYLDVNRLSQALARDLMPHTGLDMDIVRSAMAALRKMAEEHPDPAIRQMILDLLKRLEDSLEGGDSQGVEAVLKEARDRGLIPPENGEDDERPDWMTDAFLNDLRSRLEKMCQSAEDPAVRQWACAVLARIPQLISNGNWNDIVVIQKEYKEKEGNGGVPPSERPAWMTEDLLNALRRNLELLCQQAKDPAVREWACAAVNRLGQAIREGNWEVVSGIFGDAQSRLVSVLIDQPELAEILMPWPIIGADGKVQFFPPNLSQPGIGRSYIGGEGANLVREEQYFVDVVQTGSEMVLQPKAGERRDWRFQIQIVQDTRTETGRSVSFELSESRRMGTFAQERWRILDNGRTVGEGSGRSGQFEFVTSGNYQIQFSGETDWGSPFRVAITVPIVIAQ